MSRVSHVPSSGAPGPLRWECGLQLDAAVAPGGFIHGGCPGSCRNLRIRAGPTPPRARMARCLHRSGAWIPIRLGVPSVLILRLRQNQVPGVANSAQWARVHTTNRIDHMDFPGTFGQSDQPDRRGGPPGGIPPAPGGGACLGLVRVGQS